MNFHHVEKVMPTCLEQQGQRHACKAHKRNIMEPLYVVPYRFFSFLDHLEELIHHQLEFIFIKLKEEPSFRSTEDLIEPLGRLLNQSKATPLRVSMN